MNLFRRFKYYAKRGGFLFALVMGFHSVFLHDRHENGSRLWQKFYNYFLTLPPEQYEDELRQQLHLIIPNGQKYNIDNPATFNDKIQWLKLHDYSPIKTTLADKYAVRQWVKDTIGEEYLIPLVGGPWKCGEEIDFDKLPSQFVIKANHGSGEVIIVRNKAQIDRQAIIKTVNQWVNVLYGWFGMESHYFSIPRKIFAEGLIEQKNGDLVDYKIHCFNGKPQIIQIIGNRDLLKHSALEAFFDTDWNRIPLMYHSYEQYTTPPQKPGCLDEMIQTAKILSSGFRYVRVDLYEIEGTVKFGEMTFTPFAGFGRWDNPDYNAIVGSMIKLN